MSISNCCLKGFTWNGTPTGRTSKLANNDTYVAGDNPDRASKPRNTFRNFPFSSQLSLKFPPARLPSCLPSCLPSTAPCTPLTCPVLLIHDLFGWTFPNIRLLADHYAAETSSTVYAPDFFGGEVLPSSILTQDLSTWSSLGLDLHAFIAKNTREIREPEI